MIPQHILQTLWFRGIQFCVGVGLIAAGIATVTHANLGTTPISTLPFTLTFVTSLSFAETTFWVNALFILGQILLLRKNFPLANFLQIPIIFFFSIIIQATMNFWDIFSFDGYFEELFVSILGNCLMAIGIVIQIRSRTIVAPVDGLILAVCQVFGQTFGRMKIANDVSLVVIASIVGLIFLGSPVGVREGTILSALMVGWLIQLIDRHFPARMPIHSSSK